MEGRAFRNSPVGCSSEGASLPHWTVTRRSIRAEARYFSHKAVTSWTLTELKASVMGCKEGMAHFLPSGYRVLWHLRASRYRVVKELVNYPVAVKFIEGSGAVRVCQVVLSCLGSRNKRKKCDKRLTHIVRVSRRRVICFFQIR